MSVRRRASIAGLDFKNNFPNSPGKIWLLKNQSWFKIQISKIPYQISLYQIWMGIENSCKWQNLYFKSFPISFRKWVWAKNEHCFLGVLQVWQSGGSESEPYWRWWRWWPGSSSHSNRDWGRAREEWVFFFVLCWGGKSWEWQLIIEPWLTGFL